MRAHEPKREIHWNGVTASYTDAELELARELYKASPDEAMVVHAMKAQFDATLSKSSEDDAIYRQMVEAGEVAMLRDPGERVRPFGLGDYVTLTEREIDEMLQIGSVWHNVNVALGTREPHGHGEREVFNEGFRLGGQYTLARYLGVEFRSKSYGQNRVGNVAPGVRARVVEFPRRLWAYDEDPDGDELWLVEGNPLDWGYKVLGYLPASEARTLGEYRAYRGNDFAYYVDRSVPLRDR